MTHPLTPFLHWGQDAPYLAETPEFQWRTMVIPVRPKSPYAASRKGGMPHLHNGMAAAFNGNTAVFGARFLCSGTTPGAIVLPNLDDVGELCARCASASEGPCVYRCLGPARELVYIGSTPNRYDRLRRHEKSAPWWPDVADVKFENYPTLLEARIAERIAIAAENPLRNVTYKRRRSSA